MNSRGEVRDDVLKELDKPLPGEEFKHWGATAEAQRAQTLIATMPGMGPEADLRSIQ
jgi:hypothetical protein